MSEESYMVGELKAIFFQNTSNYYKVLLIQLQDTNTAYDEDEIVITGNFGDIKESISYKFYGDLVNHPKYGLQFKNSRYEKLKPTSRQALVNFLSGPQFKGIGPVIAEHIVDALGEGAVDAILDQPDCLDGIKGVTAKRKQSLVHTLQEESGMDRIIIKLNEWGIQNHLAYKIYDLYQENTLDIVQDNPYRLAIDIESVGFTQVDAIAEELGIEADSPQRLQAALLQSLHDHCFRQGDSFVQADPLQVQAIQLLEKNRSFIINADWVKQALDTLISDRLVIEEDQRIYLPTLYAAECGIVTHILRLIDEGETDEINQQDLSAIIQSIEDQQGFSFGQSQKDAIAAALNSSLFILTGGPGTGKTTVVNGLVQAFAQLNDISLDRHTKGDPLPILMAAPTGRAAKRLGETTGLTATTIHRLLGLTADDDKDLQVGAGEKMLEGDLLIIDEMSMVDTWLFNQLLAAVPSHMKLILIGDKDQLPSVGPGQVFSDLIESGKIPGQELTDIYRQEADSSIPFLAAHIKEGNLPANFVQKKKDRSFIACQTKQVVDVVDQIINKAIEAGYGPFDIQVLAPLYKGPAGIDALNQRLQEVFNPNPTGRRKEVKVFDQVYRINDKVLQLTNEADLNVFNGDLGTVEAIDLAQDNADKLDRMTIRFDDTEVEYQRSDFNKIKLAYCMSIHKAQGSEFKTVVLPFVKAYHRMLRKDLLYTAITRASESLILCGELEAFAYSLNHHSHNRNTTLIHRFEEAEGRPSDSYADYQATDTQGPAILTLHLIESESISPMIGMEGISPYDL